MHIQTIKIPWIQRKRNCRNWRMRKVAQFQVLRQHPHKLWWIRRIRLLQQRWIPIQRGERWPEIVILVSRRMETFSLPKEHQKRLIGNCLIKTSPVWGIFYFFKGCLCFVFVATFSSCYCEKIFPYISVCKNFVDCFCLGKKIPVYLNKKKEV